MSTHSRGLRTAVSTGAVVMVGMVLVLVAALAGCGSGATGKAAPEFSGTTMDGVDVSLSAYRGKPLVLAFMASW